MTCLFGFCSTTDIIDCAHDVLVEMNEPRAKALQPTANSSYKVDDVF